MNTCDVIASKLSGMVLRDYGYSGFGLVVGLMKPKIFTKYDEHISYVCKKYREEGKCVCKSCKVHDNINKNNSLGTFSIEMGDDDERSIFKIYGAYIDNEDKDPCLMLVVGRDIFVMEYTMEFDILETNSIYDYLQLALTFEILYYATRVCDGCFDSKKELCTKVGNKFMCDNFIHQRTMYALEDLFTLYKYLQELDSDVRKTIIMLYLNFYDLRFQ